MLQIMFSKEFLDHQQHALQEILHRLTGQDTRVENDRVSDDGDMATVEDETSTHLSLLSSNRQAVADVQAALKRLDLGTYGLCELSGEKIPEMRLEAVPWARYTIAAQQQIERREKARRGRSQQYGASGIFSEEEAECGTAD